MLAAPDAGPARGPEAPDLQSSDRTVLDTWLRQSLGRAFNATLQEPVPDFLLRMLAPSPAGQPAKGY